MSIFDIPHYIDVAWHWLVAFLNVIIICGIGVLGFMWSPVFKTFFLGIALGAAALAALNLDIINFNRMIAKPAQPQYCINPSADPNGPAKQCWHSTDSARGYGYWGACDGDQ